MTVPRHTALSDFSQGVAIDTLYEQAVEFVLGNKDACCASLQRHFRIGYNLALQLRKRLVDNGALQGIEKHIEPEKVLIRVVDLADSPAHALVELVVCDASGDQRLATTSARMPRSAALAIARLYDKANDIPPPFKV